MPNAPTDAQLIGQLTRTNQMVAAALLKRAEANATATPLGFIGFIAYAAVIGGVAVMIGVLSR